MSILTRLLLIVLIAAPLASCGVRGDPEAPKLTTAAR